MHIKEQLLKIDPDVGELLQLTQYFAVSEITPDSEISDAYQSVVKEQSIRSKYVWLARYCKQDEIDDMQLCIHFDDRVHHALEEIEKKVVTVIRRILNWILNIKTEMHTRYFAILLFLSSISVKLRCTTL